MNSDLELLYSLNKDHLSLCEINKGESPQLQGLLLEDHH